MNEPRRIGSLIALEGMDGCGKTLAREYLTHSFIRNGLPAISTHEIGGTPIGKELRNIAFCKREDETLDPISRLLLLYASRMQHIRKVIEPAIRNGTHVITDRFNDSTRIYQGKIDNLDKQMDQIEACNPLRMLAARANYVLYFKVDTEIAFNRGVARKNVDNDTYKNDLTKAELINKSYDNLFLDLYKKSPSSVFVVDANKDIPHVKQQLDNFVAMFKSMIQLGRADDDSAII